jgi:HSP20 family protein
MANLTRRGEENGEASLQRRDQLAWDPFRLMREMLGWSGGFAPSFEMSESEDGFLLHADLPGVKEEDLEISVTGNRLTISGHREHESSETRGHTHTSERSFGQFTRSFTLPTGTDPEQISAEMENGVLHLRIAKRPEHQPRRIAVGKRGGHKQKT